MTLFSGDDKKYKNRGKHKKIPTHPHHDSYHLLEAEDGDDGACDHDRDRRHEHRVQHLFYFNYYPRLYSHIIFYFNVLVNTLSLLEHEGRSQLLI